MEIKWTNLACMVFFVVALIMVIQMHEQMAAFIGSMGNIGPGHSPDQQIMGLISLGIVSAILLGIITILKRNDP